MATITAIQTEATRPQTILPGNLISTLTARIGKMMKIAQQAYEISLERRQLMKMTDSQLADVGLTRYEVAKESKRSFFDIPSR